MLFIKVFFNFLNSKFALSLLDKLYNDLFKKYNINLKENENSEERKEVKNGGYQKENAKKVLDVLR